MEHWSRGADIVGSAGILPAGAGMLPEASTCIAIDLAKAQCSSVREKLSGRMPDRAGCKPALPFPL
jgi:hypothetical protein